MYNARASIASHLASVLVSYKTNKKKLESSMMLEILHHECCVPIRPTNQMAFYLVSNTTEIQASMDVEQLM